MSPWKIPIDLSGLCCLGFLVSCAPNERYEKPAETLGIDGIYQADGGPRLVIDRGRIFSESDKRLVAIEVREVGRGLYSCRRFLIMLKTSDDGKHFRPCRIQARSDAELVVETLPIPELSYAGRTEIFRRVAETNTTPPAEPDTSEFQDQETADLPNALTLELEPTERIVVATSEQVTVTAGVKVRMRRSRTIEHSMTFTDTRQGEGGTTVSVPAFFSLQVKGILEQKLDRSLQQSETIEQEVELDGSLNQRYNLVWYDRVRTGTVHFRDGEKLKSIPFTFREVAALRVEGIE